VTPPRVLLLTGASRGIGRGIAQYFLDRGYVVCGCSRSSSDLVAERYHHTELDVSDEKAVRAWISGVARQFGRVDVAVCCAGVVKSALMMAVTPTSILDEFMATHVRGTFVVCREASKVMIRQRMGRIINISSLAVPMHLKGAAAYAATKAAVEEMTRVMAKELAPTGVTCNIIGPALVMTGPALAMGADWAKWLVEQQTIQRTIETDEVCNAIEFFASPASGAITGQTLNMCYVA
jgi:3-oxoacyl-[acyl-carrier protein] reductase